MCLIKNGTNFGTTFNMYLYAIALNIYIVCHFKWNEMLPATGMAYQCLECKYFFLIFINIYFWLESFSRPNEPFCPSPWLFIFFYYFLKYQYQVCQIYYLFCLSIPLIRVLISQASFLIAYFLIPDICNFVCHVNPKFIKVLIKISHFHTKAHC